MLRNLGLGLLILHGMIHLAGFVKAFQLAELKELNLAISKQVGLLWLLAFSLFVITAWLWASSRQSWWLAALVAVFLSQSLIILSWEGAKAGTVANFLVLLMIGFGFASWKFHNQYMKDVGSNLVAGANADFSPLTEEDLGPLPRAVQKYIRLSGAVGKQKVKNFRVVFKGKIRKDDTAPWMPFTSEQYNFLDNAGRYFFMKAEMKKLPVSGYHRYEEEKASMDIRLFSAFRVQYQTGPEMDKAETVTFFNDMCCMAPASLIDPRITWTEKDSHQVHARFQNGKLSIDADLYFNEKGELINFLSKDRYNVDEQKVLPWETPLKNYKDFSGISLATYADANYLYPDRKLTYGIFELEEIEYNIKPE